MDNQQRMTDERRKEIHERAELIRKEGACSQSENFLDDCEAELHRLEQAHAELHRYNDSIGLHDCEFCEALERVGEGGADSR